MIQRKILSLTTIPFTSPCCQQCCGCDNVNCDCCGIVGGTIDATLSCPSCAGVNQTVTLTWTDNLITGGLGGSGFEVSVTVGLCVWNLALSCNGNIWAAYLETPYAASNTSCEFDCNTLTGTSQHNNVYWSTCYGETIIDPNCNDVTVNITYDASNAEITPLYNQCCAALDCCGFTNGDIINATINFPGCSVLDGMVVPLTFGTALIGNGFHGNLLGDCFPSYFELICSENTWTAYFVGSSSGSPAVETIFSCDGNGSASFENVNVLCEFPGTCGEDPLYLVNFTISFSI